MRLLFLRALVIGLLHLPATSHAALQPTSCLSQLDEAVSLHNAGNVSNAAAQLKQLAQNCPDLPQVHHNLGVIAGLEQQWQAAIAHFQRAVAEDTRTNHTQQHVQAIHQYRAAVAYQHALGVNTPLKTPKLSMQNSSIANTTYQTPPKTALHNISTVDYELFSWWTAAATDATPSWLEHYATGYPPLENTDARAVDWDKVQRDISFTAQDAVVVLNYDVGSVEKRLLLLLRLQNNRWKIYRENVL